MADIARVKLLTPKARLSYPTLFRARAQQEGQEEKFSCALIFDAEAQKTPEFAAMKAAAGAAAKAKWGDKIPSNMRNPFRDGAEKDSEGYGPGTIFINVSSKQKPGVVRKTGPRPEDIESIFDENDVYAGMYVVVSVSPYAYDAKGNKGVSFGLNNVLKVGEGDPLGGRSSAANDFAGIAAPPVTGGGASSAADLF